MAVSRARDQLWLFHSAGLSDLHSECLRHRLLEYCRDPKLDHSARVLTELAELQRRAEDPLERQPGTQPKPFDSWFEVDVYLKIVTRGYRVVPQYEVAGRYIDLVVQGIRGALAVECYGDEVHGPNQYAKDEERQRMLERCGWTFFIVWGHAFCRDPDEALTPLWHMLDRLGIRPQSDWGAQAEEPVAPEASPETEDFQEAPGEAMSGGGEEEGEEEQKPEPQKTQPQAHEAAEEETADPGTERLGRALDWSRRRQQRPENLPPATIQAAITTVLRECPNHTCMLKSITTRVLKHLSIRTRGNPRADFEKRVMRNIGAMKRKGLVQEYKAKNRRIRLIVDEERTLL